MPLSAGSSASDVAGVVTSNPVEPTAVCFVSVSGRQEENEFYREAYVSCLTVVFDFSVSARTLRAEIPALKTVCEPGEDPLKCHCDALDIKSITRLPTFYFRELGEPSFTNAVFMDEFNAVRER
ncbi:unnamed protein product [Dibothriocephalus latus]|uniref:Uncharacterized protein n=1 Tax=Dibothriocephalus latus TaxID=60516 RepID=A0A3P7M0P7_DIBLA|nr:unnamed protein product [Dibothriocephalus latus]